MNDIGVSVMVCKSDVVRRRRKFSHNRSWRCSSLS